MKYYSREDKGILSRILRAYSKKDIAGKVTFSMVFLLQYFLLQYRTFLENSGILSETLNVWGKGSILTKITEKSSKIQFVTLGLRAVGTNELLTKLHVPKCIFSLQENLSFWSWENAVFLTNQVLRSKFLSMSHFFDKPIKCSLFERGNQKCSDKSIPYRNKLK